MKVIHWDEGALRAERRALEIIKNVRRPNLLAVFGVWESGKSLVIATELADATLMDRLKEAVVQGAAGISSDELHEYMREAAKGIDALNKPRRRGQKMIQHRDIKPQNLQLSGGSVKVGDFGLARAMAGEVTGHTGSMSLAYAAPECLDGKTSASSDQYSLAITVKVANRSSTNHVDLLRVDVTSISGATIYRRVDTQLPKESVTIIGTSELDGYALQPGDRLTFGFGNRESIEFEIPVDSLVNRAWDGGASAYRRLRQWWD